MNLEGRSDQRSGLRGRLDIGDVLEAPLHLRPLAPPGAVGTGKVILEREMLQRQQEDRQPGPLPGLGELLQEVGVVVGAVASGLEVLAELVENQKERSVAGKAAGDLDERCRRRAGSAGIVGRRVVERRGQAVSCGKAFRGGGSPYARRTAESSARSTVRLSDSRRAVTKPRWKPHALVP